MNGMSTTSHAVTKNRSRLRVDMRGREDFATLSPTSAVLSEGTSGMGCTAMISCPQPSASSGLESLFTGAGFAGTAAFAGAAGAVAFGVSLVVSLVVTVVVTLGVAAGVVAAATFFLSRKASAPRSRSSQKAFRKKTADRVNRIKLMNKPSTVVTVPVAIVQAIPKRGTMPMTMEITSIIGSNSPPYYCSHGERRSVGTTAQSAHSAYWVLNVASTVLLSLAASVTFCSCVPLFSC